jgi:hypothetical protein
MNCFFFHNWKWTNLGEANYTNLMGGSNWYMEMKGECKDCGLIKYKAIRI